MPLFLTKFTTVGLTEGFIKLSLEKLWDLEGSVLYIVYEQTFNGLCHKLMKYIGYGSNLWWCSRPWTTLQPEVSQRKFYNVSFLKARVGSHGINCCALPRSNIPVAITGNLSHNGWNECDSRLCLNISLVTGVVSTQLAGQSKRWPVGSISREMLFRSL